MTCINTLALLKPTLEELTEDLRYRRHLQRGTNDQQKINARAILDQRPLESIR